MWASFSETRATKLGRRGDFHLHQLRVSKKRGLRVFEKDGLRVSEKLAYVYNAGSESHGVESWPIHRA
jgi:hypothetical protein